MTSAAYESLRKSGYALAGELGALDQRACLYQHMYEDSGKRNVFPLIAAHGALWATGYFKKGMLAGKLLSLFFLFNPRLRREKLRAASAFADRFRDINRRVCAESHALYYYTKRYGGDAFIRSLIGDQFADILCACHLSIETDLPFAKEQREQLFAAFLNWEQEYIVGPLVDAAFADFHWSLVRFLAQRLKLELAYFGKGFSLQFSHFSSRQERIKRGLQAYGRAEDVGLKYVEYALGFYQLAPKEQRDPRAFYQAMGGAAWTERAASAG